VAVFEVHLHPQIAVGPRPRRPKLTLHRRLVANYFVVSTGVRRIDEFLCCFVLWLQHFFIILY
jgi:hypothetical protein